MNSRTVPHSAEAETAILGAALLDSARVFDVCDTAGICDECFDTAANRAVYGVMRRMYATGVPVDPVTVSEELKRAGIYDKIGGMAQLEHLIDGAPVIAHADYYASILIEKHTLRKIINVSAAVMEKCYKADRNVELILAETEQDVLSISETNKNGVADFTLSIKDTAEKINTLVSRPDGLSGLSTGFKNIDDKLLGMRDAEMIVLAARPSMGKTSLAMNICENLALGCDVGGKPDTRKRVPVGIFSCEMSNEALLTRLLCSRSKIDMHSAMKHFMSPSEVRNRLNAAISDYKDAPIFIDDTGGLDVMDLRARARRMKKRHNIGFLMIDYLQLLNSRSYSDQGRQFETCHISGNIKAMAKELDIPVLILSQLSKTRGHSRRTAAHFAPVRFRLHRTGSRRRDVALAAFIL